MGTLLGLIFCTVLIGTKTLAVQGTVYSSPDTTLRFSQCLIEKMRESQFFTAEDYDAMIEVANVMAQPLLHPISTKISEKMLLVAFVTSLADVIIREDISTTSHRKGVYTGALEQCSLLTTGYIDRDFINKALGIMSSIEKSKLSEFDETGILGGEVVSSETYYSNINRQIPDAFDPFAIQPSPIQNPYMPVNTDPNGKTIFEMPKSSLDSYPIPVTSHSDTNFQRQSATGFFPGSATSSLAQAGSSFAVVSSDASKATYFGEISETPFSALNVPQTKESTVIVIPPSGKRQFVSDKPSSEQSPELSEKFQPTKMESISRQQESAFAMTPSESLPHTIGQNPNISSNPSLENIVLNILMDSTTFRDTFNPEIPQEDAVNLARVITEQSLVGYNSDIINEALTAVSDEVAKVSFRTPENYALALSNALVPILKLHNLPMFVDGTKIATNFLSNLHNAKQLSSQAENFEEQRKDYNSDDNVNPKRNEKQVDYDFQSPFLAPEDVDGEIFSEVLIKQLSKSDELAYYFCSIDDPAKKTTYFNIIKSSLNDYGSQISSIAANIASSVLAELSKEDVCSNYAKAISEVIAEILEENRVLENANAEDISNKMIFALSQLTTQEQISTTENLQSTNVESSAYKTTSVLQPSFSSSFHKNQNTSASPSILNQTSTGHKISPVENSNYKTDLPSEKFAEFSVPPRPIQTSDIEDSKTGYGSDKDYYTSPVTTSYKTKAITDEEFTSALTLVETVTSLSESSTTETSVKWTNDGIIDQEALASYLFEEFESALEAYNGPATTTLSSLQTEEKDDNKTFIFDEAKYKSSRGQIGSDILTGKKIALPSDSVSEDSYVQDRYDSLDTLSSYTSPDDSSDKVDLVELQPSFQIPQSKGVSSSSVSSESGASTFATEYNCTLSVMAKTVSQIAISSIDFIRSGNFDMTDLCPRINELASIVNIPPLQYCSEIPAIDYLLNVLRSAIKLFKVDEC